MMALVQSSSSDDCSCGNASHFSPLSWDGEPQWDGSPSSHEPLAQPIYPEMVVPDTLQASLNTPLWPWLYHDAHLSGDSNTFAEAQMPPPPNAVVAADFFPTTDPHPQMCPTVASTFPYLPLPATSSDPWEAPASWPLALTHWNADGHDDSRREVGSQAQTEASSKRRVIQRRHPFFTCQQCGKTFTRKKNLTDHELRHRNRKEHICSLSDCVSRFNTRSDLERHTRVVHKRYLRRYIAYDAYESLAHHPQKQLHTADDSVKDRRHGLHRFRRHPMATPSRPFAVISLNRPALM